MINLFRNVRHKLAGDNRPIKYARYAIGEIILVVIGILIALQINTWNNNRMNKQKENLLLAELHSEFIGNKLQLDSILFIHKRSMISSAYLLSRLPIKKIEDENLDSLSYHIWWSGWYSTFDPSKGVTNSIMNSNSFDLISNDELRKLLISWNDVLLDYQEEEQLARENYNFHLKPFEKKHFNLNVYDYTKILSDSRVDLGILQNLEFDNYVQDRYNDLNNIVNNEQDEIGLIIKIINRIIELSEP